MKPLRGTAGIKAISDMRRHLRVRSVEGEKVAFQNDGCIGEKKNGDGDTAGELRGGTRGRKPKLDQDSRMIALPPSNHEGERLGTCVAACVTRGQGGVKNETGDGGWVEQEKKNLHRPQDTHQRSTRVPSAARCCSQQDAQWCLLRFPICRGSCTMTQHAAAMLHVRSCGGTLSFD